MRPHSPRCATFDSLCTGSIVQQHREILAVYRPVHREVAIAVGEQCQHPREFGAQGGCSCLGESFGRFDSLSLGDECDDQDQLFLFTEVFTQVFSACDFVAPTISTIPTLITAGSVVYDAMTAIKSGSAGDDCTSLSISAALDIARYAWHVDLSGVRTSAGSTSIQLDFNQAKTRKIKREFMKSFFGSFERRIRFKNTPEAICGDGAVLRVKPVYSDVPAWLGA